MDERDLVDMIIERYGFVSDAVEATKELLDRIRLDADRFVRCVEEELSNTLMEYELCPECGSQMEVVDSYDEYRGEFWGSSSYETINTYGCSNCNYIEK